MANPYEKYLGGEDKLQRAIMNYLIMQYPDAIFTHPMNEGKRSKFEQYKMKYLGAKPGIPDLLIFTPNNVFSGLAVELKYKYNKPTDNQKSGLNGLKIAIGPYIGPMISTIALISLTNTLKMN